MPSDVDSVDAVVHSPAKPSAIGKARSVDQSHEGISAAEGSNSAGPAKKVREGLQLL